MWSDGLVRRTSHIDSPLIREPEPGSTSIYACVFWVILLLSEVRFNGSSGLPLRTESWVMQEASESDVNTSGVQFR